MDYNLLDEDWIPVLYRNGDWRRVGIRKALEEAHRIRQIAASNPMDRVAILRFLLALLYWCRGNPPEEGSGAPSEGFPSEWFSMLVENRECFNLLGDGKRFYQDPSAARKRAVTDLIQEIPAGNNFWHFRHATDATDGLCPSCCAMGLLRLPLYSVSGLPDLKAGINGTPPVYVVSIRQSLRDTLLANWTPRGEPGTPAWVDPSVRPHPDKKVPVLVGLTLLSRRVFLHHPEDAPGPCIGCGERICQIIRTCEFQTAGEQSTDHWVDPHVIYSDDTPAKSSKATDLRSAGKFRMDRPWPDLVARIVETGKADLGPASLFIVGFATNKALNIDVWERTISMSSTVPDKARGPLMARQWYREGSWLEKRTGRSEAEGKAAITGVRPHVEDGVSGKIGDLLAGDEAAWTDVANEYRPLMETLSKSLSPGFTTSAVARRRQIANVAPDMRPKAAPEKKPAAKKRGKQ